MRKLFLAVLAKLLSICLEEDFEDKKSSFEEDNIWIMSSSDYKQKTSASAKFFPRKLSNLHSTRPE